MILNAKQLEQIFPLVGTWASSPARLYRNHLLAVSDTQVWPDYVSDDWRTYRQALRDLPSQAEFPENITWPTPPVAPS